MSDPNPGSAASSCPMSGRAVTDRYFLEHRAKVLDVAAYLDRLERSQEPDDDFRDRALRDTIAILLDGEPERARRVLERLSDPTQDPIDVAPGKGAAGAPPSPTP